MEKNWILWDFFPWNLNPFYFNNTIVWLIGWLKKEEVEKKWYMWRDHEIKVDIPKGNKVIKNIELNNYQWFNRLYRLYSLRCFYLINLYTVESI